MCTRIKVLNYLSARLNYSTTSSIYKTHSCQQLLQMRSDLSVQVAGRIEFLRKISSDLSFMTVRDETGSIQILVKNNSSLSHLKPESVVSVQGILRDRPANAKNVKSVDGLKEVEATKITILNTTSSSLPFVPSQISKIPDESVRLKYRYLDLKRPALQHNLRLRSKVTHWIRDFLHTQRDFVEIETPLLFKSTPEGAREFIIPTRRRNQFYALPQSPQQYKQILMYILLLV